jgi:hypothetical protein
MKKHFLLLSLSLIILGISSTVFATSGACSSHGGVNCSAGAGDNGQAICNDGWDGSSVSYYSVAECQTTPTAPSCTLPIQNYCPGGPSYISTCGAPALGTMYSSCIASCASQTNQYQTEMANYNSCITQQQSIQQQQEISSINLQQNENQKKQKMQDLIDAINLKTYQQNELIKEEQKQLDLNASCGDSLAKYNQASSKCECPNDFDFVENKCVLNQEKFNSTSNEILSGILKASTSTASTINKSSESDLAPHAFKGSSVIINSATTSEHKTALQGFVINQDSQASSTATTTTFSTTTKNLPAPLQPSGKNIFDRIYSFIKSLF